MNLNENSNFLVEVIADSYTKHGNRLTTMVVCFPRMILAEFNTHRMLSRNSASSRAVPFNRMVHMVRENPFIPIAFQKDHRGMQGTEYFKDEELKERIDYWLACRDRAVLSAQTLSNHGVTKQICNRVLEPFMWHTVIVSATDWQNFFSLRVHEAAEIHMQQIAGMMLKVYNNSEPEFLDDGQWHLPFSDTIDEGRLGNMLLENNNQGYTDEEMSSAIRDICTARCARVSYLNFEGKDDYRADINLCAMMREQGHWSAFEHCAQAGGNMRMGNFKGFIQYRKMFQNENRTDSRVRRLTRHENFE